MSETKHTPGPWCWGVNIAAKDVRLYGDGDKYVMSFLRWGNSAEPYFIDRAKSIILPCRKFLVPEPGREHHSDCWGIIDHPDAQLIAAAPELLEACEELLEAMEVDCKTCLTRFACRKHCVIRKAKDAIKKAKGENNQ